MMRMKKKLEEMEEWGGLRSKLLSLRTYLAETHPDKVLDETEEVDVTLRLKRERVPFSLAPHVVEALKQRAKEEGKSISLLVEQWLTEKLFIKEPKFKEQS